MNRFLVLIFFVASVISCDNNTTENKSETKTEPKATPSNQQEIYLPSIPMDDIKILWDNSNQVDYIYYELPISTSLSDQYSIQQSLRHVSDTPVQLGNKNNCKPISRVFYKKDGEDLMEAEIYFSKGCSFFVFFKEGKPAYSNLMTNDGVEHYNNILQKVLSIQPQQ